MRAQLRDKWQNDLEDNHQIRGEKSWLMVGEDTTMIV